MLFHRRQHAQFTLHTSGVVIMDIGLNHLHKLPLAGKPSAVIAFPLEDTPEALHGAVIDAMCNTGHALRHASLHELVVEGAVGVLESSVTMEQGMRVRIGFHSLIKGLENQRIVIAFAEHIGHNAPVAKVEDGAQIEFLYLHTLKPLEFGHIGEPLLIGLCGIKLPVQKVFGKILRVLRPPRATVAAVLDGGLNAFGAADTQNAFVIDIYIVVMAQFVVDAPVALVRALRVNLLDFFRKRRVLYSTGTQFAGCPLIVCRARNTQ